MTDCPYEYCPVTFVVNRLYTQIRIREFDNPKTIADILRTMNDDQKYALYCLIGEAFNYTETHDSVVPKSENDILQEFEAYRKLSRKEISENG